MAAREPKDLLTRLADAGEDAMQRLSEVPGAERLVNATQQLRDRVDEMQRKLRGIDALEKRVAELEREVAELRGGKPSSSAGTPAKRTTSSKSGSGRKSSSSSSSKKSA